KASAERLSIVPRPRSTTRWLTGGAKIDRSPAAMTTEATTAKTMRGPRAAQRIERYERGATRWRSGPVRSSLPLKREEGIAFPDPSSRESPTPPPRISSPAPGQLYAAAVTVLAPMLLGTCKEVPSGAGWLL